VYLVDRAGLIVYSGKINNMYEDIEKRRAVVTEFYLRDAIDPS
jgi:galactitol-specific phosphotransferase system IIB component